MKTYGLHFRYRNQLNELCDVGVTCEAKNVHEARRIGNGLIKDHPKAWFCGLISVESAKATGGVLP